MDIRKRIHDGQIGKYTGLANGLGRINDHIYNVQRSYYYLIGGLSGTGKTTLVDFVLQTAIKHAENVLPLQVFYYSYEIDEETKFTQWLSNYIFTEHSIEIPAKKIAGLGDNRLTQQEYDIVNAALPGFEKIFNQVDFRFDPTNPTGIYKELLDYYKLNGQIIEEEYEGLDEFGTVKIQKRIIGYRPNDPSKQVIVLLDHIALLKLERKFSLKENIDKMSEYCVWFRNIFGTTFFMLQQFNQGLHTIDRKKYSGEELIPQQNDFKDSGNPFQDADVAIGIMDPHAMGGAIRKIFDYDLSAIKKDFRLVNIMKNRKGRSHIVYGYYFNSRAGYFRVLPHPREMTTAIYKQINEGNYH